MDIVTTNNLQKSTLQYEQSNQSNTEVRTLTLEEMSKQLFERILEINTNGYLENNLTSSIDFNCNISKFFQPLLDLILNCEKSMQNPPSNSNRDYKLILCQALIIVEQDNIGNKRWAQAVQTSFKGIKSLVTDIDKYERRVPMKDRLQIHALSR
ncbi:hypothetical protein RhiirA4_471959 [Rhizophagus irregularis]|uniref:Uncharacterized protein n=1 Tax=Rhizophagus irregularis TaxID=588596 RepID=A0A2I1H418_9GLOM|nr:hypothetical protein RhiirA4_471959 [Rhizophagus irregularis]